MELIAAVLTGAGTVLATYWVVARPALVAVRQMRYAGFNVEPPKLPPPTEVVIRED